MSRRATPRRDEGARLAQEQLLHNMSCRPDVTLQRQPAAVMRLVEIAVPVASPARRRQGIDAAAGFLERARGPQPRGRVAAWLGLLGMPVPSTLAARERALVERLQEAVAGAGLPPVVALVEARGEAMPGLSDRLDVVLGVLAKSSGAAFVARCEPVIARLLSRTRATLVLPPDWRPLP